MLLVAGTALRAAFRGMAYGREFHVRERFIADARHTKYVPDEILVAFKPGVSDKEKYGIHQRCGSTAAYPGYVGRFERAKFGKGKGVEEMVVANSSFLCQPIEFS